MKKSQTGFNIVAALLIVVILGLVGVTGLYVYHIKTSTDTNQPYKTGVSSKTTAVYTDADGEHKVYVNPTKSYTLLYPKDWTIFNGPTPESAVDGIGIGPSSNTTLITVVSHNSNATPKDFIISGEQHPVIVQEVTENINGNPAYFQEMQLDNSSSLIYAISHNGKIVTLSMTKQSSIPSLPTVDNSQYVTQLEQIATSVKILK